MPLRIPTMILVPYHFVMKITVATVLGEGIEGCDERVYGFSYLLSAHVETSTLEDNVASLDEVSIEPGFDRLVLLVLTV